jgi:ATP-dependent Clp protease ATP-binding subunit ClpA
MNESQPKHQLRDIGGVRAPYVERARKALDLAAEEAQRYSHNYIGQEHILLGLLRVEDTVAAKILSSLGVNLDRVRNKVEHMIGRGNRAVSRGDLVYTLRATRGLQLAVEEASDLGHAYLGTEHILLGILREGSGVGFQILSDLEVSLEQARSSIIRFLVAGGNPVELARNNVITVRLSDRDLDAIDALVEAGVRSTRSDAAAWLIGMAIDGNPELFKRVYTTVTDIRRLRGETQAAVQKLAPEREDRPGRGQAAP